jgi:tetratricopeptide (TPR) repeat protein
VIARTCIDGLASALGPALPTAAAVELPTTQECADALAYTRYDELNVITAMVRLTSDPPFLDQVDHSRRQRIAEADIQSRLKALTPKDVEHCLETYRNAISRRPDDWPLRFNLGAFYEELRQYPLALEQFRWLVQRFPKYKAFRLRLGNVLAQSGDKSAALIEFNEGLKIDPEDQRLKEASDQLQRK